MELNARMNSMKHMFWLLAGLLILSVPVSSSIAPMAPMVFGLTIMITSAFLYQIARRLFSYAVIRYFR